MTEDEQRPDGPEIPHALAVRGWVLKSRLTHQTSIRRWSMEAPTVDKLLGTLEHLTPAAAMVEAEIRHMLYDKGWWLRPAGPHNNPLSSFFAANYDRRLETARCTSFDELLLAVATLDAQPPPPAPAPEPIPVVPVARPLPAALVLDDDASLLVRMAPLGPSANLAERSRQAEVLTVVDADGALFDQAKSTYCGTLVLEENRIVSVFGWQQRQWICVYRRDYGSVDEQYLSALEVVELGTTDLAWQPRAGDVELAGRIIRHENTYKVLGVALLRITLRKPLAPDPRKRCMRVRRHTWLPAKLEREGYIVEKQAASDTGMLFRCRHEKAKNITTAWHRHQHAAVEELQQLVLQREEARQRRLERRAAKAEIVAGDPQDVPQTRPEQLALF
jgi:hypothetical protein